MREFFELFGKNMRSIIALVTVVCGFVFMFQNKDRNNNDVMALVVIVLTYYFGSSKDKSDREKADIAQTSSASVETTITKDKNEPE